MEPPILKEKEPEGNTSTPISDYQALPDPSPSLIQKQPAHVTVDPAVMTEPANSSTESIKRYPSRIRNKPNYLKDYQTK